MSKIEDAAKPLGFNVDKRNYKVIISVSSQHLLQLNINFILFVLIFQIMQMKLKGDKNGRKGQLSVATEVMIIDPWWMLDPSDLQMKCKLDFKKWRIVFPYLMIFIRRKIKAQIINVWCLYGNICTHHAIMLWLQFEIWTTSRLIYLCWYPLICIVILTWFEKSSFFFW